MSPDEFLKAVEAAERAERIKRGLPPDHILKLREFPFTFATDAMASFRDAVSQWHSNDRSAASALYCAMGAAAQSDFDTANALMEECQSLEHNDGKARLRFGLEPAPSAEHLPEVIGDYPSGGLFLCCDREYFTRYTIPLLVSIASHSKKTPVHIHYFGQNVAGINAVLGKIGLQGTVTHEDPREYISRTKIAALAYYGGVRLIRFAEALETSKSPLCITDVDALVTENLSRLPSTPLAMRIRPGRIEPWNQFSACMIVGSRTSLDYFRRVAAILKAELPYAWWGMDQQALLSAWIALKPVLSLIGPNVAAVTSEKPGTVWFTAGRSKIGLATDDTPYARLFRTYSS